MRIQTVFKFTLPALVLSLAVLASVPAAGEKFIRQHEVKAQRGFHGSAGVIRRSFRSDSEAKAVLRRILKASGLSGMEDRILLRASAEIDSAVALIEKRSGKEERLIIYNASFMQEIANQANNYWAKVAILAHEIGHHVRLHTVISGRNHEFELEADYQSGFIMRKLGATLAEAQSVFKILGPDQATLTHPARADRVQAVTLGWIDSGDGAKKPTTKPLTKSKPSNEPRRQPTKRTNRVIAKLPGRWHGEYKCQGGTTGAEVYFSKASESGVRGTMRYFRISGKPHFEPATFAFEGHYDKQTGRFRFLPGRWIKRPNRGYKVFPFELSMSSDWQRLSGRWLSNSLGCGNIRLRR